MERATIVTLSGEETSPVTLDISSYEEAFGEYSNLFGARARARRQARRKRRELRKIERIERRARIKAARRKKRLEAMRDRQLRRLERKRLRLERKRLGEETEEEGEEGEEGAAPRETAGGEMGGGEMGGGGGYAGGESAGGGEIGGGGGYAGGESAGGGEMGGGGGYAGGGESAGGGGGYGQAGEEWGGAPPSMGEEGGGESDVYSNDNEGSGAGEGTGSESDFEGSMDDTYGEFSGQSIKVSSTVADITKKIEWNKELISRLRVKRAEILGINGDTSDIDNQISNRMARISQLEDMLNRYSSFSDEFSYATEEELSNLEYTDGSDAFDYLEGDAFDYADGNQQVKCMSIKKALPSMVERRKAEISRGRRLAKRMRKGYVTPVKSSLNPKISPNQIVIPPSMGGNVGTPTLTPTEAVASNVKKYKIIADAPRYKINRIGSKFIITPLGGAHLTVGTIIQGVQSTEVVANVTNPISVIKISGQSSYIYSDKAQETSGFDGGYELDPEMMDYDSPSSRVVELSSNADGDGSKTNWTTLALGVGLGILGVWAIGRLKTK